MTAQDKALKENTASAPLQIVAPGTCVETGEQAALVLGMYDHLVETIHQYNPSADFAQIDKASSKIFPKDALLRNLLLDYVKQCEQKGQFVTSQVEGRIKVSASN